MQNFKPLILDSIYSFLVPFKCMRRDSFLFFLFKLQEVMVCHDHVALRISNSSFQVILNEYLLYQHASYRILKIPLETRCETLFGIIIK